MATITTLQVPEYRYGGKKDGQAWRSFSENPFRAGRPPSQARSALSRTFIGEAELSGNRVCRRGLSGPCIKASLVWIPRTPVASARSGLCVGGASSTGYLLGDFGSMMPVTIFDGVEFWTAASITLYDDLG